MDDEELDFDLISMSEEDLVCEIRRLRKGIRNHRNSSGHDLCWYVPELWNLLPEKIEINPFIPCELDFIENCVKYRRSLK